MQRQLVRVATYSEGMWQGLSHVVGEPCCWQHLRSECVRAVAIACGYMVKETFSVVDEPPWMYTQGDIRGHVERLAALDMGAVPSDEASYKIHMGIRSGISVITFVEGLELLKHASMTNNMNERAHGFAARLREDHKRYGYEQVAGRATLNACKTCFLPTAAQARVSRLLRKVDRLGRHAPPSHAFPGRCRREARRSGLRGGADS